MRRHVEWLASHLDPNCFVKAFKIRFQRLKGLNSDHSISPIIYLNTQAAARLGTNGPFSCVKDQSFINILSFTGSDNALELLMKQHQKMNAINRVSDLSKDK